MKRGRKPPKHEPLICGGCGAAPRIKDGVLLPCECGAAWNLDVLDAARRPKWLANLKGG